MAFKSKKTVRPEVSNVNEIVFRNIISVIENTESWIGTMTSLGSIINRMSSRNQRNILPKSPAALRTVINRIINRLRNRGISVKFGRTPDHNRTRFVKFAQ